MEAVVHYGLQNLLVSVDTVANLVQIGNEICQKLLVVIWKKSELPLGSIHSFMNVNSEHMEDKAMLRTEEKVN